MPCAWTLYNDIQLLLTVQFQLVGIDEGVRHALCAIKKRFPSCTGSAVDLKLDGCIAFFQNEVTRLSYQ
jgi:hypothetical protein